MNLLLEPWIPVRSLYGGSPKKIALRELLCGDDKWGLCLPRDDMELAALQLLICIMQTLITPKTIIELKTRIAKSLPKEEYDLAIQPFSDWFQLDHPKYPFMQMRGAKVITPMDKLFAGITGAENCCFVNEPGLVKELCGGCTAIALFNQASCTPGFGGGFKEPLRSGTPITTLIQGAHLRQTVWLNVLHEDEVKRILPWHHTTSKQKPTWIAPITTGTKSAESIGIVRGLFWQPAHIELMPPTKKESMCYLCGQPTSQCYTRFKKDKFSNYKISGTWPHPHSPRILELKRGGEIEHRFPSFTSIAPAWSQLNRFVIQQRPEVSIEGYEPAAVVLQSKQIYGQQSQKLHLIIGGYGRKKASIVRRCHEVYAFSPGWDEHPLVIKDFVWYGIEYKNALTEAVSLFCKGKKDKYDSAKNLNGIGEKIRLYKIAEDQYYRRSEPV
ncbi:MAG: type I-E CRISPR-associated protein Cse1/CasA, partial [Desulfobacterales bacterium]|nr:type I-E CRISPR-associated protein Cse1/CasA [Desulfobacterales bacterium]